MDVKFRRKPRTRGERVDGFVFQFGKHIMLFVMFAIFLGGLIVGTVFLKTDTNVQNKVSELFTSFLSLTVGQTFFKNFINQLFINLLFLIISFVFGLCAIGTPISLMLPLIKGIGIGAVSAFMYSTYALKGFGYCTLIFFPPQIISTLCVIASSKECFCMSKELFTMIFDSKNGRSNYTEIKMYIIRFEVFLAVNVIASLIGGVLNTYALKLMNF